MIPPLAPHSCNPVNGQFRSYHMLYLDARWCLAHLPALNNNQRFCARSRYPQSAIVPALCKPRGTYAATANDAGNGCRTSIAAFAAVAVGQHQDNLSAASQYLQRERLQSSLLTPPSLDELAHECHMRKETLIRTFKRDTGLTPEAI